MVLRPAFALLSATLVLASLTAPALAGHQNSGVTSYTACLVIGGGQIESVAIGNSPLKPCGPNQVLIHLSGGDITKIIAGTGLTGGGDSGAVTVNVDAAHSLPLGCASGQVAKSNGSTVWTCANDDNTTFSNDTGLDLNGTQFGITQTFQLPQGCPFGQLPKWNGATWSCESHVKAGQSCATKQFANGATTGGALNCTTPSVAVAGTVHQAFGANTPTDTSEAYHGVVLVSKMVPVGLYQVTAYVTTDISDLNGHDNVGPPLCSVGTDEAGHNITRLVRSNNTDIGAIPWSYTVFIEASAGHETIMLTCKVDGLGIDGTFFDPQLNASSVSAVQ